MKNYFLLIDTETSLDGLVVDFAAVLIDKNGNIVTDCAVLVDGIFTDAINHPLFHNRDAGPFNTEKLTARYAAYNRMVQNGQRMIATVPAINNWLGKAATNYKPVLTAYNLSFDIDKCNKTGIDLTGFPRLFCLWHRSIELFAHTRKYRKMVLALHAINPRTDLGNLSYKTNCETMAAFVLNNPNLPPEPHTALEDCIQFEIHILKAVLKRKSVRKLLESRMSYNWRSYQLKDWFQPR